MVAPGGFEPPFPGPEPGVIVHYTKGLLVAHTGFEPVSQDFLRSERIGAWKSRLGARDTTSDQSPG